jgi:hypothetical protein
MDIFDSLKLADFENVEIEFLKIIVIEILVKKFDSHLKNSLILINSV